MGWLPQCNATLENANLTEVEIWHGWTYHKLGKYIAAGFALVAVVQSLLLIFLHATHYLKPWEQKHIIRILFMVPIYATISWLSYEYYRKAIYFEVIRDCYEAFAIAAFFALICSYIAEDLHQQKNYFRTISPKKWIIPVPWFQKCCGGEHGMWRTPRSGLTWFNVIWTGVFQYCFVRVAMTVVAVTTQAFGRYCQESLNPAFAHIWVMVIEAAAVSVAMYCIIQFYYQLKDDIRQYKPLLKVVAIKLVIFLSFWQTLVISFLTSAGAIKPGSHFQTPDIKVGLPNFLLCLEMAFFAFFHFWAFTWRPYKINSKENRTEYVAGFDPSMQKYQGGPLGIYAILDAFNPWDMIKAVGRSGRWLFVGRKTRMLDHSYAIGRTAPDDAFGADQSAYGANKLDTLHTTRTYAGAAELGAKPPGEIPKPYARGAAYEGEVLLPNAQPAPFGGRDVSPYRPSAAVIGVAKTTADEDEDEFWDDQDYNGGRHPLSQHDYRAGGQESGIAPPGQYVDHDSNQYHARNNHAPMPYAPAPSGYDPSGAGWVARR